MPLFYQSGEQVQPGDRVLLNGEPATIESIHDAAEDPGDWHVRAHGGGVMVIEPKVFGRLFINAPISDDEDLKFLSRGDASTGPQGEFL